MNEATVDGRRISFHEAGAGEPVLLLHPGFVADGMLPLLGRPELAGFRLIAPHRSGYGASEPRPAPVAMGDLALELLGLMDQLGIGAAHAVGHSFGANVALEACRIAPERFASLALLEPPLGFFMSSEATGVITSVIGQAMQQFASGDVEAASTTWLDGAFGPGWQQLLDQRLPGASGQVVKDAPTALAVEGGALQTWQFGPADVGQISAPILSVVHPQAGWTGFHEVHQGLVAASAEALEVELPSHLLQILDPAPVAGGVARFLSRHPIESPTGTSAA
ncbi:alpha/beta fold hydrolase [Arthrobacter sp. CJ23]|uniref:alpha/beta fold hydrolase n=1 Tax=Arthrobacter sp. CJ23 TaxID=2972479 RepID=UPI00215B7AD1|nr:alpha/beta hydrolase [Arthrobacter sp. CJ23]UVJ38942.1 alpha/beta fold hydrolase [Arthrobacter sp. CJ23]